MRQPVTACGNKSLGDAIGVASTEETEFGKLDVKSQNPNHKWMIRSPWLNFSLLSEITVRAGKQICLILDCTGFCDLRAQAD
jgi:hypothetical protein